MPRRQLYYANNKMNYSNLSTLVILDTHKTCHEAVFVNNSLFRICKYIIKRNDLYLILKAQGQRIVP